MGHILNDLRESCSAQNKEVLKKILKNTVMELCQGAWDPTDRASNGQS